MKTRVSLRYFVTDYETSKQSIFIHNSGNLLIFDRDYETKQVFLDTSKAFDKVWRDSAMFR